jgi:hypothetical protein
MTFPMIIVTLILQAFMSLFTKSQKRHNRRGKIRERVRNINKAIIDLDNAILEDNISDAVSIVYQYPQFTLDYNKDGTLNNVLSATGVKGLLGIVLNFPRNLISSEKALFPYSLCSSG